MTKSILLLLLLLMLGGVGLSQENKPCLAKSNVLLDKKKATVYISLERIGKEEVVLRIHNNTPWAIIVTTDNFDESIQSRFRTRLCNGQSVLGLPDGFEVDAWYQIAQDPPPSSYIGQPPKYEYIPPLMYPDVGGSDTPLLSGRSFTFKVKREHLVSPRRVYLSFQYEWETEDHGGYPTEPEHRVYFDAWTYGLNKK
jgi:hypothetical protein